MNCSRCAKPATWQWRNFKEEFRYTVVFRYLCAECKPKFTELTQSRYELLG